MRKLATRLVLPGLVLALALCPGCKRRGEVARDSTEMGPVTLTPDGEFPLTSSLFDIGDYREPTDEEKAVFQDIHFAFDRSEVRPVDRPILQGIAGHLEANPNVYLLIEGHCDERGTSEYNLALGERRAGSTREFLIGLGVHADRLATISLGEEDPIDPDHDEEAWAANRRAHFKIAVKTEEVTE